MNIKSSTKQLAVIGHPICHSMSPDIHNYLFEIYKKDYVYTAFDVLPENLESAISGIRALGISGVNVTAPHKIEVMKYIDKTDDNAKRLGAVNTIVNKDGTLWGYNTDAEGLYRYLLHMNVDIKDKDILIIGAGGASFPITVFFARCKPKSIAVKNRTQKKADELADYVYHDSGFKVETENFKKRYDVVINTTSAGMYPDISKCPIDDFSAIDENTAAVDLIYNPPETMFLKKAKENGAKTINGLGMLIYQGLLAYELFTGATITEDVYDRVEKEVFGK